MGFQIHKWTKYMIGSPNDPLPRATACTNPKNMHASHSTSISPYPQSSRSSVRTSETARSRVESSFRIPSRFLYDLPHFCHLAIAPFLISFPLGFCSWRGRTGLSSLVLSLSPPSLPFFPRGSNRNLPSLLHELVKAVVKWSASRRFSEISVMSSGGRVSIMTVSWTFTLQGKVVRARDLKGQFDRLILSEIVERTFCKPPESELYLDISK